MHREIKPLYQNRFLRGLVLPILKRFNPGNIRIRHHYTGEKILLHTFRHKGYWYHGRRREARTMEFFRQVIKPGDTVIEVGGHIGYISMFFSHLVGVQGKVVVFEPGSNNLPYIEHNLSPLANVELVPVAVSDQDGEACFYEEEITGQNNSMFSDYHIFEENRQHAFSNENYHERQVTTTRLDTFIGRSDCVPDFLKIDIEGAERLALEGASSAIAKYAPVILVEVTKEKDQVYNLLARLGYEFYKDTGVPLRTPEEFDRNVCALHSDKHAQLIERCGWKRYNAA